MTAALLRDTGARAGTIFGQLSDAEAYTMILERNTALLGSIVTGIAEQLAKDQPAILVTDAAEGYNPVHDLCRLIGGAAIVMAGVRTKLYEYAVVNHPDSVGAAEIVVELDDAEYAAKLASARAQAGSLTDVAACWGSTARMRIGARRFVPLPIGRPSIATHRRCTNAMAKSALPRAIT
jgi:hypothetical protein